MRADIVCGAVMLLVVAAFWPQRDFNDRLTGVFPDFVLLTLALLGVLIIARGVLRGDRTRQPREVDLRMLSAGAALLVLWALGMGLIGFTISGVLAFVAMTLLIRRGRPEPRRLAMDVGVAVVVVVGCFLVFTRVLLVPLPVSTLIGM